MALIYITRHAKWWWSFHVSDDQSKALKVMRVNRNLTRKPNSQKTIFKENGGRENIFK